MVRASFLNTFSINKNSAQSYPGDVGSGLHDGRTGAVENNTLGYTWNGCPVGRSQRSNLFRFAGRQTARRHAERLQRLGKGNKRSG